MSYSQAYHLDCEQAVEQYDSDCCIPTEFGRVRSVAFIRKAYLQQILNDPQDQTIWQAGIDDGQVLIIPFTSGQFDSGEPVKYKGYGRRTSTHGKRDMNLEFFIAAAIENYNFFNKLDKKTDYVPAFRTSSWIHIFDTPADITTKEVVEDDLESVIIWSVTCNVRSRNIPTKRNASSIASLFTCSIDGIHNHILTVAGNHLLTVPGNQRILYVP